MKGIQLFIEDQEVELSGNTPIPLNREFEDLQDPTIIINDWSKTIQIPSTSNNNKIFGFSNNVDKTIVSVVRDNLLGKNFHTNYLYEQFPLIYENDILHYTRSTPVIQIGWVNKITGEFYNAGSGLFNNGDYHFSFVYNPVSTYMFCISFSTSSNLRNIEAQATWTLDENKLVAGRTYDIYLTLNKGVSFIDISNIKIEEAQTSTGILFDPYKKLDFKLIQNGSLLMSGYAKVIDIVHNGTNVYYNITLNGQLGKLFQEFSKITFDRTSLNNDYIIEGYSYLDYIIDKEHLKQCWSISSAPSASEESFKKLPEKYDEIIGFAPTNAFDDIFNYTLYINSDDSISKFTDLIESSPDFDKMYDPTSFFPDGKVSNLSLNTFVTYLQQPFIYFNKLFRIFKDKAEYLTHYKWVLDESWFNDNNPMWRNLVYMLGWDNAPTTDKINRYLLSDTTSTWLVGDTNFSDAYLNFSIINEQVPIVNLVSTNPSTEFNLEGISQGNIIIPIGSDFGKITVKVDIPEQSRDPQYHSKFQLGGGYCILVELDKINLETGSLLETHVSSLFGSQAEQTFKDYVKDLVTETYGRFISDGYKEIKMGNFTTNADQSEMWIDIKECFTAFKSLYPIQGDSQGYQMKVYWIKRPDVTPISTYVYEYATGLYNGFNGNTYVTLNSNEMDIEIDSSKRASGNKLDLNSLWNNNYNVFEEILKYCKANNIYIYVNENDKTLHFDTMNTYFSEYKILNYGDKLDISKGMTIKPISFDNKYILFDYEKSESELMKQYAENYKDQYGSKRIKTNWNFDEKTKTTLKLNKPSIVKTVTYFDYDSVKSGKNAVDIFPVNLIDDSGSENKRIDVFGTWLFWKENKTIKNFKIQDTQIYNKQELIPFCYIDKTYDFYNLTHNKITELSTFVNVDNEYQSLLFEYPKRRFTSNKVPSDITFVYDRIWECYLDERYNIQNKLVTCYLRLTPIDWNIFEFNNFIKIENQLYFVNKIYDYNPAGDGVTKVDLLTIQDISAYTG